jgi:hypothetical protein
VKGLRSGPIVRYGGRRQLGPGAAHERDLQALFPGRCFFRDEFEFDVRLLTWLIAQIEKAPGLEFGWVFETEEEFSAAGS